MSFAGDPQALALSLKAVERGWLEAEPEHARRQFWLMPLMHAEDLAVQEAALPLFQRFCDPRTADFARRHRDVIPLWPVPPPQCPLGAGVERRGAGFSADARVPVLKQFSAQPGREESATGVHRAASLVGAACVHMEAGLK